MRGELQPDVEQSRAQGEQSDSGENARPQGTADARSPTRRHAETSAVRNEALVERDSVGCGRWREQQELSDRRGTRRRPSTAELGGNLLRCGDGPSDAHGPAAAGANGDVDAEDAGEELHPRQARGGSVAELSVEQGGDGGELQLAYSRSPQANSSQAWLFCPTAQPVPMPSHSS